MLALYGLVASGLPLPVALPPATGTAAARTLAGKDRSQPFPCMDKACGCDSAERCFTNCCCHTPAETLAWATARGIEPAVIAALKRRVAATEPAPQASSCCAATVPEPSCCQTVPTEQPSCCTLAAADGPADRAICCDEQSLAADRAAPPADPGANEAEHSSARGVVTLRAMLACGGIVDQWAAASVSLPPPRVEFAFAAGSQELLCCTDDEPLRRPIKPALPPPRDC